jgi:guanylate kinase
MKKGLIFVISGPSGSGKTTLLEKLLQRRGLPRSLKKSVSFTTRPPRSGEKEGKDYIFLSPRKFQAKLRQGKILEWTRYLGYSYGTPKDFARKAVEAGRHLILCLDLRGVARIRKLYPQNAVAIFIAPPSVGALRTRIAGRCSRTHKEEIRQRLKLAQKELRAAPGFDHCVVNRSLAQAVRKLKKIVLAEIARTAK